ncbi:MAG: hypothetical protein BroJett011_03930 [Chloroflexota bacterium]|nr:MAG: hypothetical protein BroJett011_03930 [Chloroflexota bacterium]
MALGPRDKSSLVMLTGWDATALKNFQLEDGTSIETVVAELNVALGALNAELAGGMWADAVSFTDQPDVEYRVGVANGFEEHTEYGRPDAKRADTEGHMLPFKPYDRALGWTWDYLRDARMEQIRADIADAIKDARDLWRQKILTRALKRGDDSGAKNGLGTSGYSPGWATAAASTNVDFTPPAFEGTSFDSNHEHYVAIAGGAFTNAVFEDAYDELREHGHQPPFDFWIGPSDRQAVEALSKFTKAADPLVQLGLTQDRANVNMADYIGVIEQFRVREVRGIPQYYGFGFKSYGARSQRNPFRIRLKKGKGAPMVMAMQDPRNGSGAHPLQYLMLLLEFGVGISDRTNGTARYVNNATWSDGSPT